MKICPMTSSFHLPHNTTKCQRAGEGRIRGKKSRGGSVSEHRQHDMFGPEEVKQRRSEAEWERGREIWRETSHVQSHSPLGCTRKHTPSIIWLQLTHTWSNGPTHTSKIPSNGLLLLPFSNKPTCHCSTSAMFLKNFF